MSLSDIPAWIQMLIAAGAVYAGIRADLARITEKAENASKAAARAHERLDNLVTLRAGK